MNFQVENVTDLLAQTWNGALICAGITSGIFDSLSPNQPITLSEVAEKKNYDPEKLEKWFYYAENFNLVKKTKDSYLLTDQGVIFSKHSPVKDLLGLVRITEYYLNGALNAPETFKKGKSVDSLSEGKISRQYQPRISDNFSLALIDTLKENNLKPGDSLLDIGCGNASFLRNLLGVIKDLKLTGIDSNLFAIEKGKKENTEMGFTDKINLLVGDVTEDLNDFEDNSFDWVSALNIFHFVKPESRFPIIDNMIRIAKKGIFFTEVIIESLPMTSAANPLMALVWNDFTGFFKKAESDELNQKIQTKYKSFKIKNIPVLVNSSELILVLKN